MHLDTSLLIEGIDYRHTGKLRKRRCVQLFPSDTIKALKKAAKSR
jgi:hypothetical protein